MAITVEMRTQISQLYVALFGRAPDGEGLGFWTQLLDDGTSLVEVANMMYGTDPARDYYPLFLTNEEIIASFYLNVLGRPADAEGLAFWTAKLNAPGATVGDVIVEMVDVVANYTGVDPDGLESQALFNNKVEVAQYYGESNGNIADAAVVLSTVTSDDATVDAAIEAIDGGFIGSDGLQLSLTTGQDTLVGSVGNDEVAGTYGAATGNTYTAGDSIDLGDGALDSLNLAVAGTIAAPAVIVKNTEIINIQDTIGSTFDALLVENDPAINFTNTVDGNVSKVSGGGLGSVYGLQGAGDLTVDFANTAGTNTAMVSLSGAGTSATNTSTVNVSDTDTVEKVTVATTGTNYVTLVGGAAAASLAVTGDGANTFVLSGAGALAAVATIDASASTGTNSFALGSNFNTGTVVKGGTGADSLSASLTTATLVAPTLTGVETFSTTWTADAILDLAAATGLTSLSINDKALAAGTVTVQNAQASLATVTVSNVDATAADSALNVGYGAATKGDLTLNIGSTTAVDLGAVTISNSNSLNVNSVGALDHNFNSLKVNGDQTTLGFTVAADGSLDTGMVTATGNINVLNLTTAANAGFSGDFDIAAGKNLGAVNITGATGSTISTDIWLNGGDVGNVTVNVTGDDFSGWLGLGASGGSIGDVSVSLTGDDNEYGFAISAGFISGEADDIAQGNIGNVTITVTGEDNTFSGGVDAKHGDIGDITMNVTGDGNDVSFSGDAVQSYYYHSQTADQDSGYYYVAGGNIGNVSVNIDGDSSGNMDLLASGGGQIGDITIVLDNSADFDISVETDAGVSWIKDVPMTAGNIGNISVTLGDDTSFSGAFSADGGDIGNVTVSVAGDDADLEMIVTAVHASAGYGWGTGDSDDYFKGGNVGDVSLSVAGEDATYALDVVASGGDIGAVTIDISGEGASGWVYLSAQMYGSGSPGGDTGAIDVTLADNTSLWLGFDVDRALGALTVVAGNDVWFEVSGGGGDGGSTTGSPASTGAASLTFGDNADVWYHVSGFSGSIGAITGTLGDDGEADFAFDSIDGSVGAITLTVGAATDASIIYDEIVGSTGAVNFTGGAGSTFYMSGGAGTSVGKVTLTGGDASASAGIWIDSGTSMGGVDASAWLGSLGVDLGAVGPTGTTIRVGAGGSWVQGTEGADNIFLGAGMDTVEFDATPTTTDTIFSFTVGASKDSLDLVAAATVLEAVLTADAASNGSSGDILRLVDITGGDDITTVDGLIAAVEGGEYTSVTMDASATFTIVTAASSTASTFNVFHVFDANGDQVFDAGEVTLLGQVTASATSAIGGLVLGNFA